MMKMATSNDNKLEDDDDILDNDDDDNWLPAMMSLNGRALYATHCDLPELWLSHSQHHKGKVQKKKEEKN